MKNINGDYLSVDVMKSDTLLISCELFLFSWIQGPSCAFVTACTAWPGVLSRDIIFATETIKSTMVWAFLKVHLQRSLTS